MADESINWGADASELLKELNAIIKKFEQYEDALKDADEKIVKVDKDLNIQGATFRKQITDAKNLVATYGLLDKQLKILSATIVDNTKKLEAAERKRASLRLAKDELKLARSRSQEEQDIVDAVANLKQKYSEQELRNATFNELEISKLSRKQAIQQIKFAEQTIREQQKRADKLLRIEQDRLKAELKENQRVDKEIRKLEEDQTKHVEREAEKRFKAQQRLTSKLQAVKLKATEDFEKELEKERIREERITEAAERARKQGQQMILSWQSMARLLVVQLSHRAISRIANAIEEGAVFAIELQKRIAEIQTISQEAQLTTVEWVEGLRELSDAFGLDIMDQAEAAYQTLSNQVAEGAEALEFLAEANRFAITTVSSTADAVNLLTSAINAFNIPVENAEEIAAKFFKTIELGRVRASEMANSFGEIAVMAAQLGIGFDELDAAIDTITIQGIKYVKAATQIRGIMIKLLKPTEDMKVLFKDMGATSAEALIRAEGFGGFLAELQERTRGSSTEFAKHINRVRGFSGALALTGRGLDIYNDRLAEIQNATESYGRATELVLQNTGKRLEIELTKIRNFFTADWGDRLLRWLGETTDNFEHLSTAVIEASKAIAVSLGVIAGALALLALTNPIILIAASITALIGGIRIFNGIIKESAESFRKEWDRVLEQFKDKYEDVFKSVMNTNLEFVNENLRLVDRMILEFNKVTNVAIDDQLKIAEQIAENIKGVSSNIVEDVRNQVSAIRKLYKEYDNIVTTSQERINKTIQESEQRQFDTSLLGRKPQDQINRITRRIQQLAKQSAAAATEGDLDVFIQLRERIEALIDTRSKLRVELINEEIERQKKLGIISDTLAKTKTENSLARERARLEREMRQDLQERVKLEKELAKVVEDKAVATRKELAERVVLQNALEKTINAIEDFSLEDVLALEKPEQIQQALKDQENLLVKLGKIGDQLGVDIPSLIDYEHQLFQAEETALQRINQLEVQHAQEGLQLKEEVLKAKLQAIEKEKKETVNALIEMIKPLIDLESGIQAGRFAPLGGESLTRTAQILTGVDLTQLTTLLNRIIIDLGSGKSSSANLNRVFDTIERFLDSKYQEGGLAGEYYKRAGIPINTPKELWEAGLFGENVIQASDALRDFTNLFIEAKKILTARGLEDALNDLRKGQEDTHIFEQDMKVIQDEIRALLQDQGISEESLPEIEELEQQAVNILGEIRDGIQDIVDRMKNTSGRGFMFGGLAFDKGGMVPRGTDTVPAMLTPGEFVMNRRATERFYSQLVAMNSSIRPNYYGEGGRVTNIGGIDVTVNEAVTPQLTANQVASAINRGIRMGTIQIRS
jgi:TP901 family phage tail tape measure protein